MRGGYQMAGLSGSATDDHNWWEKLLNGAWTNTHSWSIANDLFTFQMLHYPGGTVVATQPGQLATVSSGGQVGDLLFFDWSSDGYKDHVGIQVVMNGRDPTKGWYGDLLDAHSNDHYHAFWSL